MARQLSGKNGVMIGEGSGGGSGGGGDITFVSIPEVRGGSRVAIGRPNSFNLSALCLLSNARVLWFTVIGTGGAIGGVFPAVHEKDGTNTASAIINISADTQVGAAIHMTVTARDNYGNESLPAEITVTATEGYVTTPVLYAPLSETDISPISFYVVTDPFSVLGDADSQVAAQYRVLTNDEKNEVLYDSGELTESTEFTRHNIRLYEIPAIRIPIIVQARRKGLLNGWSDYSAPVACFTSPDRLIIAGHNVSATTSVFGSLNNFEETAYTLPSGTRIFSMYEMEETHVALTQLDDYWQVFTSIDLLEWKGPYRITPTANLTNPTFSSFNGHLFLCGRSIFRSSNKGETWTALHLATANASYGVLCADEKYCYYTESIYSSPSSSTGYVLRSSDGLIFTKKQLITSSVDWYYARLDTLSGALGNGLVILVTKRFNRLLVSQDYGESYTEYPVAEGIFNDSVFQNNKFFVWNGSNYVICNNKLTKGSLDGTSWGVPETLVGTVINFTVINHTKLRYFSSIFKGASTIRESTDMKSWAVVGVIPDFLRLDTFSYYRTKSGEDVLFYSAYYRSKDNVTWKSLSGADVSNGVNINWTDACYAFGKFIRVGKGNGWEGSHGYIATSVDGVTWNAPNKLIDGYGFELIRYAKGVVVASNEQYALAVSTDGVTWKIVWPHVTNTNHSCSFSASSSEFLWLQQSGVVWKSTDAFLWSKQTVPSLPGMSQYIGGMESTAPKCHVFLFRGTSAAPNGGCGYTTNGGTDWNFRQFATPGVLPNYAHIHATSGNVVVFIRDINVLAVTDTGIYLGVSTLASACNSASYINGAFYACLADGRVQVSTNGINWSVPATPVIPSFAIGSGAVAMSNA